MLTSILKEHQSKQATFKDEQDIRRKEALGAANDLTHALVDHLNVGVAQAYLNQKKLDAEAKQLHNNALQFSKQTQQWLSLVDNFNSALKEIGDVENWAKVIEEDMRLISAALETAYEGSMNENSAIAAREEN